MPVIASAVSALLLAFALPNELAPYGNAIVGFFCIAPYFAALGRTSSRREAALAGFVFGAASHALSSYWLFFFQDFAVWTIGSTSVAYGILHLIIAPFLRELSLTVGRKGAPLGTGGRDVADALRPFILAAAWTVWEWQKSVGFLGYPWGLVALAVNDIPVLTQIADATGVYGLSFLLALCNAVLAEFDRALPALRSAANSARGTAASDISTAATRTATMPLMKVVAAMPAVRAAAVACSIVVWFAVYGAWRLGDPTPVVDRVPMVLVQHNGDSWISGGEIRSLRTLISLTRNGMQDFREGKAALSNGISIDRPALIAWSETVLRRPFAEYRPFFRKNPKGDPLIPFLKETGTPLLAGAPEILNWDTYEATNSAILIRSDAQVAFSYAKRHPVPFAEAIPFWEFAWMRNFIQKVVGLESGWTMGTEATVMEIPTPSGRPLRFGVPICFEDAFADVCADFFRGGADLLINITNDSWSRTVSAETQHYVVSRFRAIENRRVLVRATNGGVTAVVDAEGRTLVSLPLFTEDALAVLVPVQRSATPTTYFLLGDWLPKLLAAVLTALIACRARATYRAVGVLRRGI